MSYGIDTVSRQTADLFAKRRTSIAVAGVNLPKMRYDDVNAPLMMSSHAD